ncbi:MAG: nucleotidyltransferase domain-containing protein, partial [Candidatus Paceibacterota bacterium]
KIQENLREFKKTIIKHFPFIEAIGILPPEASPIIEEEEEIEKQKDEKLIHVVIAVSGEKMKKIPEIKAEAVKLVQNLKPKVWVHVKSVPEIWEMSFDGKYPLVEAISLSFPLHDKGLLGALRAAAIHKILVLKKFERYVVSYVLAGSLVREETTKSSDVDIYIIINDTDVKRMNRYELREKLRAIIYSYTHEASARAGVKNKLNAQIYILTEFWECVKDANPVIFTLIRDGVPLYDSGAFMPWKLLLKMGKIKPSPEAIDMFMSLGEKVAETVKRKLNDIVTEDIYWGVITPSQAIFMLYGMPPPTPKEIQGGIFRKIFVEREKLIEPKYADILERIVNIYKKYEHEEMKTISGKEIDELVGQSSEYIKRLKELMSQIEKKVAERDIQNLYGSVFELVQNIFGKASESVLIGKFKAALIDKNKIAPRNMVILKKLAELKKKCTSGKTTKQDVADAHRISHELTSALLEYVKRQEMIELGSKKIEIAYTAKKENKRAEMLFFKNLIFIIPDISSDVVMKWDEQSKKIKNSSREELETFIRKKEKSEQKNLGPEFLSELKKLFGEFEIILN